MLNADLNARVVKETEAMAWHDTAEAGEWLKPLEEDVGRATGVVKYAPGSVLSSPAGSVGEEIIVLEGVLADKHGDYATGTYLRNPPDVQRTLRSDAGCVLFVKRYGFDPSDTGVVRLDTAKMSWPPGWLRDSA